jgi:rod shape-determining protein MreD
MENIRITAALIVAVLLQWTARGVWEPLVHIDFVLIAVVYAALQRNAIKAIIFGSVCGIAVDALSGGLLGANGFTKTLIAYAVSEVARRVYLDNLMLRIPVLASACVISNAMLYGLNAVLGDAPSAPFGRTMVFSSVSTLIVGIFALLTIEKVPLDGISNRRTGGELFSRRRSSRRRNPIRF